MCSNCLYFVGMFSIGNTRRWQLKIRGLDGSGCQVRGVLYRLLVLIFIIDIFECA